MGALVSGSMPLPHRTLPYGVGALVSNNTPLNEPAWTISVFLIMYLCYPPVGCWLPTVRPGRVRAMALGICAFYGIVNLVVAPFGTHTAQDKNASDRRHATQGNDAWRGVACHAGQ